MSDGRAGSLLRTSGMREYRPLGAFGEPVYLSHARLQAVLEARGESELASYFARPEVEAGGERIAWYATRPGEARLIDSLEGDELVQAELAMLDVHIRLTEMVEQADAGGGGSRAADSFAQVLRQAVRSPSRSTLYVVDGKPVITLWGFEGDGESFDTLRFSRSATGAPVAAPAEAAARSARPWWRWLAWLLGLLALAALLLLLLRTCAPELLPPPLLFEEPAQGPEEEPAIERPLPADRVRVPTGTRIVEPAAGARTGVAEAGAPVEGRTEEGTVAVDDVTATEPGDAGADDGTAPEEAEGPEGEATGEEAAPPDAGEDETPSSETPEADADAGSTPDPEAQEAPAPEQPPGAEPSAEAPPPGESLQIPPPTLDSPGDVGFMRGRWRSQGALADERGGKLEQRYEFDEQGEGQVIIRREDGVECRGAASVKRGAQGNLSIEERAAVTCPDGRSFDPSRTECTAAPDGTAECVGINPDGSRYDVRIAR